MNIHEFKALVNAAHPHPEFIEFIYDDYRNEFVAITEWPETILTYSRAERTYRYSFNGAVGVRKTVKEAKAAFDEDYRLIQRQYELSRLS